MAHPRPPVVTILGHVDHGKTSLLDHIRQSRIAAREHGGITQRIGGYEIKTGIKGYPTDMITFIDTPGHEAFSKLRSRGATVADIAILVIDAKDSIKPQTEESIAHIKSAGIPFIVALNKIDLPDANPDRVKIDLLKYEVMVEDKGGQVPCLPISAINGTGIPDLLETILFIAADKQLSYDPAADPEAYIIETKKDKRGIVASIVVKNGTLTVGDTIFSNELEARIRSLSNDLGKTVKEVLPSSPVELLGFSDMPEVGSFITNTQGKKKQEEEIDQKAAAMDRLRAMVSGAKEEDTSKKLTIVLKADSQGALEAITSSLTDNENIQIKQAAVGDIHNSDIYLAKSTGSIVIGFSVKAGADIQEMAKQEKVIIKTYDIIYELLEEMVEVSDLLLEREKQKQGVKGVAKVRATFVIDQETVYGVQVTKGKLNAGDTIEILRDDEPIGQTKLVSLKQRAKTVQEVKKDQEAGMLFHPLLDIKIGDVVKSIL